MPGAGSHHTGLERFPGNKMALKMHFPAGAFFTGDSRDLNYSRKILTILW